MPCASAVERIEKNEKFALKFGSSAFLRCLWRGPRQRPFARCFHPQLWLAHLNLSANESGHWIWARAQILNGPIRVQDETTLRTTVVADPFTSTSGKPKRQILRQIFHSSRFFRPPKHRAFGVKFIGLHGTVGFIAIWDFSLWGESDLWSDFWPVMDGVVCLSILLEGGVTVSNNSTKRHQNGFKIGTRDKFATHLR